MGMGFRLKALVVCAALCSIHKRGTELSSRSCTAFRSAWHWITCYDLPGRSGTELPVASSAVPYVEKPSSTNGFAKGVGFC